MAAVADEVVVVRLAAREGFETLGAALGAWRPSFVSARLLTIAGSDAGLLALVRLRRLVTLRGRLVPLSLLLRACRRLGTSMAMTRCWTRLLGGADILSALVSVSYTHLTLPTIYSV